MKIKSLTSWMGPAFLGTILSSWVSVTLFVLLGKPAPVVHPLLTWALLVLPATGVAFGLATTMLVVDVLLLKVKMRAVPTGGPAWAMALVSPLLVGVSYWLYRPGYHGGVGAMLVSIAGPVVLSAVVVRVAFGKKLGS